jgi:hypothetical protein
MPKLNKRILIAIVLSAMVLLAIGSAGLAALAFPKLARCYLIVWSDFEEVAPNLYVSSDMSQAQRDVLIDLRKTGAARVADWFGQFTAKTIIIASAVKARVEPYGISPGGTAAAHCNRVSTYIIIGFRCCMSR